MLFIMNKTTYLGGVSLLDLDTARWAARICLYLNSAVNPIIYGLCNNKYRQAFMEVFAPKLCLKRFGEKNVAMRSNQSTNATISNTISKM